ncbi:MAG: serine hydrolase [Planctomycetota bacterium]
MTHPDRIRRLTCLAVLTCAWLAAAGVAAQNAPGQDDAALDDRIDEIARHVDAARAEASVYAPMFLDAVPLARINALYADIRARGGDVVEVTATGRDSPWSGRFRFRYAKGFENDVTLTLDAARPHRVIGLWFGPLRPTVGSFDEIVRQLADLPGRTNLMVAELRNGRPPRPIASHQPGRPLAIGSTFKLYVLAALLADDTPWDRVVYLRESHRSLPSGVLQDWPVDAPMTVFSLAAAMISISDNTATDALIDLVGRDRLAELTPRLGNEHPELNTPFLSTYELFKLRADPALAERYARANPAERLRLLDHEIAAMPRERVQPLMDRPRDIDRIEWFASAADLTRLLAWLNDNADDTARGILAINPGLTFAERFAAVGYKGGSEAGVLNLTWLLTTESGRVYALTLGWNDPDRPLDDDRLIELAEAAAGLIADEP